MGISTTDVSIMKIALVAGTLLVAGLWTVFIALSAALVDWLVGQGGQLQSGMQALSQWPVPPWIGLWLEPALVDTVRASLAWTVDLWMAIEPWITPILGWLTPLLWVAWAIGMLVLLVVCGVGLLLIGRARRGAVSLQRVV